MDTAIEDEGEITPEPKKKVNRFILGVTGGNWKTLPKCIGYSKDGSKCKRVTVSGFDWCSHHIHGRDRLAWERQKLLDGGSKTKREGMLPEEMEQSFLSLVADDNLVELRTDIAFIESRIQVLTNRLKTGEMSKSQGEIVRKLAKTLEKDIEKGITDYEQAFKELKVEVENKATRSDTWSEIYYLTGEKRKLVEAESKRERDLKLFFSLSQSTALMLRITNILTAFVPPQDLADFRQLFIRAMVDTNPNLKDVLTNEIDVETDLLDRKRKALEERMTIEIEAKDIPTKIPV